MPFENQHSGSFPGCRRLGRRSSSRYLLRPSFSQISFFSEALTCCQCRQPRCRAVHRLPGRQPLSGQPGRTWSSALAWRRRFLRSSGRSCGWPLMPVAINRRGHRADALRRYGLHPYQLPYRGRRPGGGLLWAGRAAGQGAGEAKTEFYLTKYHTYGNWRCLSGDHCRVKGRRRDKAMIFVPEHVVIMY